MPRAKKKKVEEAGETDRSVALRALAASTGGSCDPWKLAGHANRFVRQELMRVLTGSVVPIAECGVNKLMEKFCEFYGVPKLHHAGSVWELRYMNLRLTKQTPESCRGLAEKHDLLVRLQGHGLCRVWPFSYNHGQIIYGNYNTEKIAPWDVIAEAINVNAELGL